MKRSGTVSLLLAIVLFSACSLRPGAPEARAELFIEKLIASPQETGELAALAALPATGGADALVEGVAARAGLAYLRARARLGAKIRVDAGDSHAQGGVQTVSVNAREGYTGGDVVRFRVELKQRESEWRVTRVTTE
jgi:hypothetical protein